MNRRSSQSRATRKGLPWEGLVLLAVAAFFAASVPWAFVDRSSMQRHGQETTGTVTSVVRLSQQEGDSENGVSAWVRYVVADRWREEKLRISTREARDLRDGQRVQVRYDDRHPERVELATTRRPLLPFVLTVAGLVIGALALGALGGFLVVLWWRERRETRARRRAHDDATGTNPT